MVKEALASAGVRLDHLNSVKAPTGHAVVMLQPGGKNSIIIVGGANVSWPRLEDGISRLTTTMQALIRRAGAVLLQREIPDAVNLEAAKVDIHFDMGWVTVLRVQFLFVTFLQTSARSSLILTNLEIPRSQTSTSNSLTFLHGFLGLC